MKREQKYICDAIRIAIIITLLPISMLAQTWLPGKAPLMSKFAKDVKPDHVLEDYPRPQLVRKDWMNLNGLWQFSPGTTGQTMPKTFTGNILVPFAVESALSGVMEHHDRLWYHRKFEIPANWKDKKILLHFGAVDYESEIFINGKSQGIHEGGYDPFTYDITAALKPSGPQEIDVRVYDPTDSGGYPRGKQTTNPRGIMYTSVTGIWQTVWIEPVMKNYISEIHMVPDIDRSVLRLTVKTEGDTTRNTVKIRVKDGPLLVKTVNGGANQELVIPVANVKLWSPDKPFLYDLEIDLQNEAEQFDQVTSYFGMRKISVEEQGGFKKLFLNNHFLFETGPLDQGFWPDGIYTAPTDDALKYDIVMMKAYGFNMVRKHIKVEPARWYYWTDKLGLMVWQDMPSPNSYTEHVPAVDTAAFGEGLRRLVKTHWNSPSIIMWDIYNEEQGQHKTVEYVDMVHTMDPSRLINQASGGKHFNVGDILDVHSYPAPSAPFSTTQALACGEYGGIAFTIKGHTWNKGFGYITTENEKDYIGLYGEFAKDLTVFKTNNGLSASVYTQITDVETELNGLMTYDRVITKAPPEEIRKNNDLIIHDEIFLDELLPSSQKSGVSWNYTFDKPDSGWYIKNYNSTAWKTGPAGFGHMDGPVQAGNVIRTIWDTTDIWMRQEFELPPLTEIQIKNLVLLVQHDDNCEVYINGIKAADIIGYNSGYAMVAIQGDAKKTIRPGTKNVIAIHCHQTTGGQFIDAGIFVMRKNHD